MKPQNKIKDLDENKFSFNNNEEVWYILSTKSIVNKIPATIVKKISKVLYLINVRGIRRTAHGRQLRTRFSKKTCINPTDDSFEKGESSNLSQRDVSQEESDDEFFELSDSSKSDTKTSSENSESSSENVGHKIRRSERKRRPPSFYGGSSRRVF